MLDLFRRTTSTQQGTTLPGYFDEIRNRFHHNVEQVTDYLRSQAHSLENQHPLVRILSSLPVDLEESLFYNIDQLKKQVNRIARTHDITTYEQSGGVWQQGAIYGPDTHETWVSIEQDINYLDESEQWWLIRPLQILRHPDTSLSIPRIDDPDRNSYPGHAIIGIDLVALGIQYYLWHHRQRTDDAALKTPRHFLIAYPMVNALPYHVDWSIVNRLQQMSAGGTIPDTDNEWPFHLQQFDRLVDRYLRERVDELHRSNAYYETMLQQIGVAFHNSAYELTRAPQGPRTQQIEWVYWWAQLPPLHLLLSIDYQRGGSRNRSIHQDIAREVRAFLQNQAMEFHIGPMFYYDIKEAIERDIRNYLEVNA